MVMLYIEMVAGGLLPVKTYSNWITNI